jgi:glycosyltransferase involved in cell wall biosynthesis
MNVGGTAVYLSNLILGLEKLGIENLLVIGKVPKGEVESNLIEKLPIKRVNALSREMILSKDLAARKEIKEIIQNFKPDIIHSHTFKAGLLVRTIKCNFPIVHSFHGHHLYDPEFGFTKKFILNRIERILSRRCDSIITIGQKISEELLSAGIGSRYQYVAIAPGINEFKLSSRSKVLKKFGLEHEKRKIVVWLGRFTKVKRPDRVIKIAKMTNKFFFVMAGGGDLEEESRRLLPENVKMVGWQNYKDMWAIADIALCTSDSEGMPLSLIEAQMVGIPVVSTNVGSVDEIVQDRVTGRLGNNDEELLRGLEWVRANQNSRAKKNALSRNIKKLAHEKFAIETMANAHAELYRKLEV